ncbi:unnamed protein product [Miscanthus lutarioriparius]|uniref:Uncharacterized protein n=1 Tax=Miscanthus lutarioriparius TaxID=422564 RepID=A0A811N3B7_9POAL|nr:unnamed protein product [Miscanthus lutarioriparius]
MAALFASRGIKCTILTTPVNTTVLRSAVDQANNAFRGTDALAIHISTIPFPDVGLPPGVETVVGISSEADLHKLLEAHHPVPDAVVVDSFYLWAADVAAEHGIPRLSFLGSSLFARACNDSLLRNNPFALAPDDPDAVVSLPELPHRVALRRSQVMDPRKGQWKWDYGPEELRREAHPQALRCRWVRDALWMELGAGGRQRWGAAGDVASARYNEKLVVEVLKMGVGVGAGDYASHLEVRREVISGEKIAEGIDGVMGGNEEAEAIRKRLWSSVGRH